MKRQIGIRPNLMRLARRMYEAARVADELRLRLSAAEAQFELPLQTYIDGATELYYAMRWAAENE